MEAGARVIEARAALGQAIGEIYPQTQQLNGTATYLQPSDTDATSNPGNAITSSQFWRVNLGGQVAWELDLWGKFRHGVEQADAAYLASIATYDDVLVTMIGDVASDYIQIRTLQAQIAIARDNVVKQKGGARDRQRPLQGRRDLGARRLPGPERARPDGSGDPPAHRAIAADRERARASCSACRRPRSTGFSATRAAFPRRPRNVAVGVPADLLRRRPDVRAAELKAEAQSAKVGIAAADLYPAFSLGGALGTLVSTTNGNKISQLFTSPSITFAFGPSFSWPVLNYGQITNQVRAQDAELQALLIDYKNVVLKAQREVENGLAGFVQGRQQVAYLKQERRRRQTARSPSPSPNTSSARATSPRC